MLLEIFVICAFVPLLKMKQTITQHIIQAKKYTLLQQNNFIFTKLKRAWHIMPSSLTSNLIFSFTLNLRLTHFNVYFLY